MSVIVSCSTKFWAFELAEQLNKNNLLSGFYSSYAYQKNKFMRKFVQRVDREDIPAELIHTNIALAILIKGLPTDFIWNDLFDRWVAREIRHNKDFRFFVGWAGISLHSIRSAKKAGATCILERGSSHILYQNEILKEEYKNFGVDFSINEKVIKKELQEYEEADFISIPSIFVRDSFIHYGVNESKLVINNYGSRFALKKAPGKGSSEKFIILYLGGITIRKGLVYLFQALHRLGIDESKYEVWFAGKVHKEMEQTIAKFNKGNWKWMGHINHADLPGIISKCSVMVIPSIEDGFGMVIPQSLSCGVPVITTVNTGGRDIIREGFNGYVVPIRDPAAMAEKISALFSNKSLLHTMKSNAVNAIEDGFTWNDYGDRYVDFLRKMSNPTVRHSPIGK